MSTLELEIRVKRLEEQVDALRDQTGRAWWRKIRGSFSNDPVHEQAMKLGRDYRIRQEPDLDDSSDDHS